MASEARTAAQLYSDIRSDTAHSAYMLTPKIAPQNQPHRYELDDSLFNLHDKDSGVSLMTIVTQSLGKAESRLRLRCCCCHRVDGPVLRFRAVSGTAVTVGFQSLAAVSHQYMS